MSNFTEVATPAPSAAVPPTAAEMSWQRLTILDLLLLMASYSVAGSLCIQPSEHVVTQNTELYTKTDDFLWIVMTGNSLSPLFILTMQVVCRHRRKWLSTGEWLWLAPLAMLFGALLSQSFSEPLPILMFVLGVLSLCSVVAAVFLICRACGYWEKVTCRWTDIFGSLTCLFAEAVVVRDMMIHPIVI